jgi:hypothetical protein
MNPIDKRYARRLANWAQDYGLLSPEPCADCGIRKRVDKHHENHEQPLEVIWLCRSCHFKRHKHDRVRFTLQHVRTIHELLSIGVGRNWIIQYLNVDPLLVDRYIRGWKQNQLPKLLQQRAGIVP